MLHPNNNRIDFGKAMRPPEEGYDLDFAIGTSYSLDLEALIFLPTSLFFGEDLEISDKCSNEMLTALTQVSEKVQLFYQKDKIKPLTYHHPIFEYWNDSIEKIMMENHVSSFHPKIWLIRYTSSDKNNPVMYKFICTSRNMTRSTDWDTAITMDGVVEKRERKENLPLRDFIQFLDSKAKRKISSKIIEEIPLIKFELKSNSQKYSFFPIGNGWENPVFSKKFHSEDLLVISPFLDVASLKLLSEKSNKLTVLSTEYELNKLSEDAFIEGIDFYNINTLLESEPVLVDESALANDLATDYVAFEDEFNQSTSLHAKLFVSTNKDKNTWFIGSANCSSPAHTNRNIEFLTAVSSDDKSLLSSSDLLNVLTETENNREGFFVPYLKTERVINKEFEKLQQDLRRTIFDISALEINARVEENQNGEYNYKIKISNPSICKRENWKVFFQPLSGIKGKKEEISEEKTQIFTFQNYLLYRLTPFFLFSIMDGDNELKSMVLKLDIEFPENRMKRIFSYLVENRDKLMKYISFLLSKEKIDILLDLKGKDVDVKDRDKQNSNNYYQSQFPIYEKLLLAASRDENSLRQTIKIVELLKDEKGVDEEPLVDKEFKVLIETFRDFLPDEC